MNSNMNGIIICTNRRERDGVCVKFISHISTNIAVNIIVFGFKAHDIVLSGGAFLVMNAHMEAKMPNMFCSLVFKGEHMYVLTMLPLL